MAFLFTAIIATVMLVSHDVGGGGLALPAVSFVAKAIAALFAC